MSHGVSMAGQEGGRGRQVERDSPTDTAKVCQYGSEATWKETCQSAKRSCRNNDSMVTIQRGRTWGPNEGHPHGAQTSLVTTVSVNQVLAGFL